jgi:hypothetical protein
MGQRVTGAFSKYDVTPAEANAFKKLVDKHGFTPFAEIVFPKAKRNKNGGAPDGAVPDEAAPPNDTNGNEQKKDSP